MLVISITAALVVACALIAVRVRHTREQRWYSQHSVTPTELYSMLESKSEILIFDVRQPLDLLAYPEMIPGARRVPPQEILRTPSLIPKEKDTIVYCTCPSDKTSRAVLTRALSIKLFRVKFLKGGLAAWKQSGYPVEPYQEAFHLYTTA